MLQVQPTGIIGPFLAPFAGEVSGVSFFGSDLVALEICGFSLLYLSTITITNEYL